MNNFKILSKIGEGAYSVVFKVKRYEDDKIYALKKVKLLKLSKKEKENALNEVRILASVKSNFVVSYKEAFFDESDNSLGIVMEYADRGDLFQKITEFKHKNLFFSENEVWRIFIQLVKGLKALHDLKILHRDLKSANVFLFSDGSVKLGDLNVSKVAKKGLGYTQTGTPYYASPEVWDDKPYNSKSDIWSLGCVLYEMIALKPPFRAINMEGLYSKVSKGRYQKIPSRYSEDLSKIIGVLLQVSPGRRPNCDQILGFTIVQSRIDFFKTFYKNDDDEGENANLLKTINVPKNLVFLSDNLPLPNYDMSRKKSDNCLAKQTRLNKDKIENNNIRGEISSGIEEGVNKGAPVKIASNNRFTNIEYIEEKERENENDKEVLEDKEIINDNKKEVVIDKNSNANKQTDNNSIINNNQSKNEIKGPSIDTYLNNVPPFYMKLDSMKNMVHSNSCKPEDNRVSLKRNGVNKNYLGRIKISEEDCLNVNNSLSRNILNKNLLSSKSNSEIIYDYQLKRYVKKSNLKNLNNINNLNNVNSISKVNNQAINSYVQKNKKILSNIRDRKYFLPDIQPVELPNINNSHIREKRSIHHSIDSSENSNKLFKESKNPNGNLNNINNIFKLYVLNSPMNKQYNLKLNSEKFINELLNKGNNSSRLNNINSQNPENLNKGNYYKLSTPLNNNISNNSRNMAIKNLVSIKRNSMDGIN